MTTWSGVPILVFELCRFGLTKRSRPHALNPQAAIHDKRQEIDQNASAHRSAAKLTMWPRRRSRRSKG